MSFSQYLIITIILALFDITCGSMINLRNEGKFADDLIDNGRIVGGEKTTIEERPFQVMTLVDGRTHCGGALIDALTVLSAAHCFIDDSNEIKVRLGSANKSSGGVVIDVIDVITHPQYSTESGHYDAAVLKLLQQVNFTNKIQPIALADYKDEPEAGSIVVASGWGDLEQDKGWYPETLYKVALPFVAHDECRKMYPDLDDGEICAGATGKDACQGDSGGPLTYNGFHIGVVAYGNGCGKAGYAGVYTRTSAIKGFVEQWMS